MTRAIISIVLLWGALDLSYSIGHRAGERAMFRAVINYLQALGDQP